MKPGITLQGSRYTWMMQAWGDDIQCYYQRLGVVLYGTVMDGDCGVDCASQMLGLPTSREARQQLRQDLHFLN